MRKFVSSALGGYVLPAALALGLAIGGISAGRAQEAGGLADFVSTEDPPTFDQPEEAVDAFKAVLAANDFDGLAKLLGLDPVKLKTEEGVMDTFAQIREGAAKKVVIEDKDGQKTLDIGDKLWPLPFPLAKGDDGKWAFDTYAGIDEIIDRQVGENEVEAIATAQAYVDAQRDYASSDRDGDGVLEYAQKLVSSDGQTDGLYWPADAGYGESPAGEFASEAELEESAAGQGYFGYRFKVLTGQGDNIAGGNYDYIINGNMIAGFALVAWPMTYDETGVRTFVVNQQGIVYEADLGPDTETIASSMDRFNPDGTWKVVSE